MQVVQTKFPAIGLTFFWYAKNRIWSSHEFTIILKIGYTQLIRYGLNRIRILLHIPRENRTHCASENVCPFDDRKFCLK